jgi:hypothetical protein
VGVEEVAQQRRPRSRQGDHEHLPDARTFAP